MIRIRDECSDDEQVIFDLTTRAFAPMSYSDGTEQHIVNALRAQGDLALSLVAVDTAGLVLGHVAFSQVSIGFEKDGWYGLGPISVAPERQAQGIGWMLVREGLSRLQKMNAKGVALIGDPAYYSRFGFRSGGVVYGELDCKYVQWLAFDGAIATGELRFSPAFDVAGDTAS